MDAQLINNAIWQYVSSPATGVIGPQARLAPGSGHTAQQTAAPGQATMLPGYVTQNDYQPSPDSYAPPANENTNLRIPRTINQGWDGLAALNPTYRAHDFTIADLLNNQMRSAANWQEMVYPLDNRPLVSAQQVQLYQLINHREPARALNRNDYFLGYVTDPVVAATIGGQNGPGNLGG